MRRSACLDTDRAITSKDEGPSEETRALIDAGGPLRFEAYTDVTSIVERYEELDRRFPTAAFILTVRKLDDWLASRARQWA